MSSKENDHIESFYCVYLLNSLQKKNSTYIGSSNDPVRRLRQHNGVISGGAYRTKKVANRPWEMCLFVHGFPTKSMALKFEHAWQHCYQSRFTKIKHQEWAMKKSNNRGLLLKINTLKLLLNNEHFAHFDLEVVVFDTQGLNKIQNIWCQEVKSKFKFDDFNFVYKKGLNVQENYLAKVDHLNSDLSKITEENLALVKNFYDTKIAELKFLRESMAKKQVDDINECFICSKNINNISIKCYHENCHFKSHFSCIYPKILPEENDSLVPKTTFKCFNCNNEINWFTLQKL
ncbi:related to Structure-specific endonuclease subunit SLX1 [Hanseniaspora guilliermondii]|uniref:Related to Structure-specific endonuclease subunit SLX1 n=1 Tax=Hanseniaspora guilliermondii TaxID=56406 RepID=A0A1L0AZ29_9ASCO|nr:related to Structure-specific endonuclease subunit SLX1 [Hanseniaspora guilliermondii]